MGIKWRSRANSQLRPTWLVLAACARAISARHGSTGLVPLRSRASGRRAGARRIMDIVEIDCLKAHARERTVKRAHQAARRGSARKGKEFRCYHRADGTGAQAVTHDALREIDLSRVDHARAGIMNGPVCFQHGPTIGTPPLVRANSQGQPLNASSTQGTLFLSLC